jgi:hypothetical protein
MKPVGVPVKLVIKVQVHRIYFTQNCVRLIDIKYKNNKEHVTNPETNKKDTTSYYKL